LLDNLREIRYTEADIDHVVLFSMGEPLLYECIEPLIDGLRRKYRVPIAIASCGTLLWNERIRRQTHNCDIMLACLDAFDTTTFSCVNRPHSKITFSMFTQGLWDFARTYEGKLWLQVHLLDGITAINNEAILISAIVQKINPARILITTVQHSPPEDFAFPVSNERLHYFAQFFGKKVIVIEGETTQAKG
jgi:wyosine [tRNA(Phe)-imidazoG37] synthetase (radical SAM superfamily)